MMDIPFTLETVPARDAEQALERLSRERPNTVPVLLGDADIFSTEWAEMVDMFEPPEAVLDEARGIDIDAWFDGQASQHAEAEAAFAKQMKTFNLFYRLVVLPLDVLFLPFRLLGANLFLGHFGRRFGRDLCSGCPRFAASLDLGRDGFVVCPCGNDVQARLVQSAGRTVDVVNVAVLISELVDFAAHCCASREQRGY